MTDRTIEVTDSEAEAIREIARQVPQNDAYVALAQKLTDVDRSLDADLPSIDEVIAKYNTLVRSQGERVVRLVSRNDTGEVGWEVIETAAEMADEKRNNCNTPRWSDEYEGRLWDAAQQYVGDLRRELQPGDNERAARVAAAMQDCVTAWEVGGAASPSVKDYAIAAGRVLGVDFDDAIVDEIDNRTTDGQSFTEIAPYLVAYADKGDGVLPAR